MIPGRTRKSALPECADPGSAWTLRAVAQDLNERRFVPGAGQTKTIIDAAW